MTGEDDIYKTMGKRTFGGGGVKRPAPPSPAASPPPMSPAAPPNGLSQDQPASAPPLAKTPRIPAIFVDLTPEWTDLAAKLKAVCVDFEAFARGDYVRIKTTTVESFRAVQRCLSKEQAAFHTFSLAGGKTLKVVISGLPGTVDDVQIADALGERKFAVEDVTRLRTPRGLTKSWLVKMCPDSERHGSDTRKASDIYFLRELFHLQVRVSLYRKPAGPVQCHRCQKLGHGSQNCGRPPRCVRCGEPHTTWKCPKQKTDTGHCCNCGGAHNANYRGCPVFKKARAAARNPGRNQVPKSTLVGPVRQPADPDDASPPSEEEPEEEQVAERPMKRRKRPPRNPANRRPRLGEKPKKEEERTTPGMFIPRPRNTPRLRLEMPPKPAPPKEQVAPAAEEVAAPAGEKPDIKAVVAQVIQQLTALMGILTELLSAQA